MLEIHFLNVGHGDCTLIDLPSGRLMMIDINNSTSLPEDDIDALAESKGLSVQSFKSMRYIEGKLRSWEDYYKSLLVDPAEYYKTHFSGRTIFRYLQTHPDMDHLSGLHRFFWQDKIPLGNFWDVDHVKSLEGEDFENSKYAYIDWLVYQLLRAGRGPGGVDSHKTHNKLRGDTGNYWSDDNVEILSPTQDLIGECNKKESYNNCSYVVKINYAGRTVILPGDAEAAAWGSILENPGPEAIKCDILKAAHHGRESGYHKDAVDAMSPDVVICSVGKKPSTDASDEYAKHGAVVLSTRYNGTIKVKIWDDGDVWIYNHKGERIHTID